MGPSQMPSFIPRAFFAHTLFPAMSTPMQSSSAPWLNNLLHVPQISSNLLSVHQCTSDNNCSITFDNELFVIQDKLTNKFSTSLKILRTDGGGEYTNGQFEAFLKTFGIVHQLSCPRTPSQNGVVDRKHKHLIETTITLLDQSSMPLKFWFEALATAIYLINRMPSPQVDNLSPYEVLFQMVLDYGFLKIFGCKCYPWLKPYTSHKLQSRSKAYVVIGYHPSYKRYKCLDPSSASASPHVSFPSSHTPNHSDFVSVHVPTFLPYASSPVLNNPGFISSPLSSSPPGINLTILPHPSSRSLNSHSMLTRSKTTISSQNSDGSIARYKFRLVAKGYLKKLDVSDAFLHGKLEEEVFMIQPPGFVTSHCDNSLFIQTTNTTFTYLLVYVDDILVTVIASSFGFFLSQSHYASKLSLVCGLQYLTIIRQDLAFAVNQAYQHMQTPSQDDFAKVKRLLRFVQGTLYQGLHFSSTSFDLHAFLDADWASSPCDRRSISGLCLYLGSNLVSWTAKK
ncbi:uncharacterized protein LOC114284485 [Camellia sinensis]|uniref:uncharacterized protein LOC114284485 n=1 Tax=Camellia sinensis TaxID=4442 RepID=UPI0010356368|nr:uncharacterized protein LOC114284485 [Camellia sinensis]